MKDVMIALTQKIASTLVIILRCQERKNISKLSHYCKVSMFKRIEKT